MSNKCLGEMQMHGAKTGVCMKESNNVMDERIAR